MVLIGQPDTDRQRLDNPINVPGALSFLTYRRWDAEVKGLNEFPRDQWPDNIALLYYSYHIMVGLGTLFIAVMALAAFCSGAASSHDARWHALAADAELPLPLHRQHRGLDDGGARPPALADLRSDAHRHGFSSHVSAGNGLFSLLGFMGIYSVLSILFLLLIVEGADARPRGPESRASRRASRHRHPSRTLQGVRRRPPWQRSGSSSSP